MSDAFELHHGTRGDLAALEALYPNAFPDEDLVPLVRDLVSSDAISIVATIDNTVVGHAAFTPCNINSAPGKVALLAPVAIAPHVQRQGLGSAIIRCGLQEMREAGMTHAFTLGDPAYYGRFGFKPERNVMPPYARAPEHLTSEWQDAWQSLHFTNEKPNVTDALMVPKPWQRPELWLP